MENLDDSFTFTKNEKILTYDYHKIKGLTFSCRVIYKAGEAIRIHCHTGSIEIFCLMKGNRILQVNGKDYTIKGGELFVVFPGESHSTSFYTQSPCKFYGIRVDLSDKRSLLGLDVGFSESLADMLLSLDRRYRLSSASTDLIDGAFAEYCAGGDLSRSIATSYLTAFLFAVKRLKPISADTEVDGAIKKSIDYINANCHSQIKVEQLAAVSCLSLSGFKNKFKYNMGMTPSEYVNFVKIEAAKKSLATREISISDLAYELGFCSSDYFSTVFRKFVNLSPNEYRKRYAGAQFN